MRLFSVAAVVALALVSSASQASSPVVVDSQGTVLGFFIGEVEQSERVLVVSTQGYSVRYSVSDGRMGSLIDPWGVTADPDRLYYNSVDCSGTPYLEYRNNHRGGSVGRSNSGITYYIPKNAPQVNFTSASYRQAGAPCAVSITTFGPFVEALENDPIVTGVSNEPAVGPLRIEVATISGSSFDVFRDGFEPLAASA